MAAARTRTPLRERQILTTGNVAKICKVAPRTVSKWFDSGKLPGYRIPGGQDRRIQREHLIRFLQEHDMPLGELEGTLNGVLLLCGPERSQAVQARLFAAGFAVIPAFHSFEAGILACESRPVATIVDACWLPGSSRIIRGIRQAEETRGLPPTVVIGIGLPETERIPLCDDWFVSPFDTTLLVARLQTLLRQRA